MVVGGGCFTVTTVVVFNEWLCRVAFREGICRMLHLWELARVVYAEPEIRILERFGGHLSRPLTRPYLPEIYMYRSDVE